LIMPFTVSHSVVALAARKTRLPAAAVAVGAMAPDAVLFVPFLPKYAVTHSWWGVFTIDLAVSLVVLVTWWWLVRPAWASAVPGVRNRVPEAWGRPEQVPARRILAVVAGCVAGSVTHVVWDAFSHEHAWAVRRLPFLRDVIAGHPVYSIVQDASSVLGLLALVAAAVLWWRRAPRREVAPLRLPERTLVTLATALIVVVLVANTVIVLAVGGGATDIVVVLAYRLPVAIAAVLTVGAISLITTRTLTSR
jgi:hypothetical protein